MRGSGMAVQEDVRGPLVFQCRECRTIIGDSFSMVSAVESLDAIILSVAVQCTTGRRTSDGHGSMYQEVKCVCGNLIGRCFFKHPHSEQYDILSDIHHQAERSEGGVLGYDENGSYELGSGNENPQSPKLNDITTSSSTNHSLERILETIQADIAKMKAMTLLFDERLSGVEAVCKPAGSKSSSKQGDEADVPVNPKKKRK